MRHVAIAAISIGALVTDLVVGWDWRIALLAGLLILAFGEAIGRALRPRPRVVPELPSAPPSPPKSDLDPLSKREAEIARLVSEGLSNKEIAARIWRGERGVEAHVQHCYNKLGLHNRAELTRWVLERELANRHPI